VTEGVSEDAARRIADMKKPDMAQAAEQLLAGTGWLPAVLRTPQPEAEQPATVEADAAEAVERPSETEDGEASHAVAAE
jgi:ParB family chromosome partitioning protein